MPNGLSSALRRVIKWYLAPSGLLLAVTLMLFGIFFFASALTDSAWPAWFGLGATAMLGIFLPYRFSRQQGTNFLLARDLREQSNQIRADLVEHMKDQEVEAQRRADEQRLKAQRDAEDNVIARLLWLEQRNENLELRLEQRLTKLETDK